MGGQAGLAIHAGWPGPQPSEAPGVGPFYYKKGDFSIKTFKKALCSKGADFRETKRPLPGTQQGRAQSFVKKQFSPKGSDPVFE